MGHKTDTTGVQSSIVILRACISAGNSRSHSRQMRPNTWATQISDEDAACFLQICNLSPRQISSKQLKELEAITPFFLRRTLPLF